MSIQVGGDLSRRSLKKRLYFVIFPGSFVFDLVVFFVNNMYGLTQKTKIFVGTLTFSELGPVRNMSAFTLNYTQIQDKTLSWAVGNKSNCCSHVIIFTEQMMYKMYWTIQKRNMNLGQAVLQCESPVRNQLGLNSITLKLNIISDASFLAPNSTVGIYYTF